MWQILAVEDDPDVQGLIHRALGGTAELRCVGNLADAAREVERRRPDLVLLDVTLPDGEGYQLCSALQSDESTQDIPIVFLTARGGIRDKVTAFRVGADDYIEKPFQPEELRARAESRIEKAARRRRRDQVLCRGPLRIDVARHRVSTLDSDGQRDVELTPHEFRLLHHLARHEQRVFSRAQLMEAVWGDTVVLERTVDCHISNLRKKLGKAGEQILSVRGVGYRFESH